MKTIQIDLTQALSPSSNLWRIHQVLTGAGFKAWLAGGAVRDALLGKTPHDFDVVTEASIEQVKSLFPKTVLVGEQFGVLRVLEGGEEFEIAQFRRESDYRDGRRPSLVEPGTPEEDALRRDLTVNALFYDPGRKVVLDHVEGLRDLQARILRAVGDPRVRFGEDHLRILRAVRFQAQLEFRLDPDLETAVRSQAGLLKSVSRERIRDELLKLTRAPGWPDNLPFLVDSGVLANLFEGLAFKADRHVPLSPGTGEAVWWEWGLWMWRSGLSRNQALDRLAGLRLSKAELRSTGHFLQWFDEGDALPESRPGSVLARIFDPGAREGLEAWMRLDPRGPAARARWEEGLRRWTSKPDPAVRASDFPEAKGTELGRLLKAAFESQLEGQSREQILSELSRRG